MNKTLGILGYLTLIIGAAFLNIPFIGLLAIPALLAGVILLLIFYLKLITEEFGNGWVFITIGVFTLAAVLGYSSGKFNEYLVSMNRGEKLLYSPLIIIILIAAINIISSLLIFIGIRKSEKLNKETLIYFWLPTLFIIPVPIILIKLLELFGAPFSSKNTA